MNIKSLLLGSAAALAAVSGAQAADAIVAAEPEPMEYVRVCDAFGTGYFYIPGTETCLQIGGFARFQIDFGEDIYTGPAANAPDDYDFRAVGVVTFDAKSDTELGTLQGFIAIEADMSEDGTDVIYADEAYLALGGLKAGWFYSYWDASIAGETDDLKSNVEFVSIGYEYTGDAFSAGLFIDELDTYENHATGLDEHGIGIEAQVKGSFGPVTVALLGGYDTINEEGAIRAIMTAGVGPGTFNLGGFYSTDPNVYADEWEWAIASSYAFKATDKLTITPGVQYSANQIAGATWGNADMWSLGAMIDYTPVENLLVRLHLNYDDHSVTGDAFSGYFRLQRDF